MTSVFEPVTLVNLVWSGFSLTLFVATLWIGSFICPGPWVQGAVLSDGSRRRYKLNGLSLFLWVIFAAVAATASGFSLTLLPRYFASIFVVANIFALVLTWVLYAQATRKMSRRPGRRTPMSRRIVDMFFGLKRNPAWFGMDLKFFSYRPSLIGLGLFNVSFAFLQYERHGFLTAEMVLFQLLYFCYLANYFQFEYGMLYTWDLIEERFGGMLVWGDYVYVPFFYSLPGWYLVDELTPLPYPALAGILLLYLAGFWLFRGANEQKHAFKTNPRLRIWGKPAEALGGKLLVSGFWGIGRKLNYTGEFMMYSAWTLLCGFDSPVPYALPVSLALLFIHRSRRDERRCRAKYGPLWDAYCRRARFRMVPYLY